MTFLNLSVVFSVPFSFHISSYQSVFRNKEASENRGGSLTIYFALVFAVMVSLITACIYSAKVEAGRARTANAADQAIFSLFANYDQSLFSQYHIFMIDGSCGTDHLSTLTICNFLAENSDYILAPRKGHFLSTGSELLSLRRTGCAITGYTLATDLGGLPFRAQAIQSEKDTLGLQTKIISSQNISSGSRKVPQLTEEEANRPFKYEPQENYDDGSTMPAPEVEIPSDFVNPLPDLEKKRTSPLLEIVIDESRHPVSDAYVSPDTMILLSRRSLEKGFGVINAKGSSLTVTDKFFFQQYLMKHFFCFTDSIADSSGRPDFSKRCTGYGGPSYELEYLIAEKNSDKANLNAVARKLLLQREAVNLMYLQTSPQKRTEISQEALLIAAFTGVPYAAPAIEEIFSLSWAFAESLVDLYALFDGKHIAALKSAETWQTDLSDLPKLANGIAPLSDDVTGGLSYRDCLKILLSQKLLSKKSTDRLTLHAMDLIELNIQADGRPDFRLDRCIDSLSFELSVTSERKVPLTAESSFSCRQYS